MKILLLNNILHLFFPKVCAVCGNGLLQGEECLCVNCILNLPRTDYHDMEHNKTSELFAGRVPFINATSFYYYRKGSAYTNIVHALKYEGREEIGVFMGRMFAEELLKYSSYESIDLIFPIPLHKDRYKERGYNQSMSIAKGMSEILNIPIDTNSIIRAVYTKTQTRKDKAHRFENVEHIFKITDSDALIGKHVLIVDDVITTGATIESLISELIKVKNVTISIASLAIASNN